MLGFVGFLRVVYDERSCVLFGCFDRKIDGPGLPGGLVIYQGHLFPPKKDTYVKWLGLAVVKKMVPTYSTFSNLEDRPVVYGERFVCEVCCPSISPYEFWVFWVFERGF